MKTIFNGWTGLAKTILRLVLAGAISGIGWLIIRDRLSVDREVSSLRAEDIVLHKADEAHLALLQSAMSDLAQRKTKEEDLEKNIADLRSGQVELQRTLNLVLIEVRKK